MRTRLALVLSFALAGCSTVPNQLDNSGPSLLVSQIAADNGHFSERTAPEQRAMPLEREVQRARRANRQPDFEQPRPIPARATAGNNASDDEVLLNFVDADLQGVVRALARFTGRNFVVDPRVKGQLTLVSEAPVSPDTAYDMLLGALRMQGFAVVDVGGVTRVVPEADAKLQGSPVTAGAPASASGSELITRVFTLRYENAANLLPVLRPMIAPNNPINAYPGNNTLVITDYADNLDRVAQVIASIDTPATINTDIVPIRHGVALDVAALASELLENRSGGGAADPTQRISIVADPRTNSVLVNAGSPARLELARELIERIDSPNTRAGNLHVVYLRNAQATRLAEVLRGALTGQAGNSQSSSLNSSSNTRRTSGTSSLSGSSQSGTGSNTTSGSLGSSTGTSTGGSLSQENNQQSVAFSAGGATIQADPTTNTLIIAAPDPLYRGLREVIDQLDQRRAQVLVESLIVEVTADNAAEFGIQWMAGGNNLNGNRSSFIGGANFGGSGVGTSSNGATTIDMLGQGLNLGVVRGTLNILGNEVINLGVLARALETKGGVNILSTPNLMTLDNEEASIMVGRTVPFTTGRYVTSGDGAGTNPFQTIQREDIGLTLRIRPQISEGGTVKLALYQEVSSIDAAASVSADSLTTRKRALETNVLVDDGQIIVLGGLIEDTVNDSTRSVPLLGDIPLLGNLFRYDSRQRSKTNLMVFLRPHIIRNARDGASITMDRYNYIRAAQARLPIEPHWIAPNDVRNSLPDLSIDPQSGMIDMRNLTSPAQSAVPGLAPAAPDAPQAAPVGTPSTDAVQTVRIGAPRPAAAGSAQPQAIAP